MAMVSVLAAQDVRINEVVASNQNGIVDNYGDYPDWIELYNAGPQSVNLGGYGLSDDPQNPFKWLLPPVELAADSFLLVFASGRDTAQWVARWETVIQAADSARYLDVTKSMSYSWIFPAFDDSSWPQGRGGFGYGDGDDQTIVGNSLCLYYRKSFNVNDVSEIRRLIFHIDYDDAFVAYLNGNEVARKNLSSAGEHPAWNAPADEPREARMYSGGNAEEFVLDDYLNVLQNGRNVLAIEVHNYDAASSDMSLLPYLSLGHSNPDASSRPAAPELHLPEAVLHSNFKIASSGEDLSLTNADGLTLDLFQADSIPVDVSKGRYPDGDSLFYYFQTPTPGAANGADGFVAFAGEVHASVAPGTYELPVTLSLNSTASGGKIYYTTDGSVPTPNSTVYHDPFSVTASTVVRARVFLNGALPGPVMSNTYIVQEENHLPIVSISTNPENLWDEDTGIYVTGPNAEPTFPFFGANFWQDWEKPAHLEYFNSSGERITYADCGIKIFGGWSRGNGQKSLAIHFRGSYGQRTLDYPLFEGSDIGSFRSLVLRNGGNDWEFARLRDMLSASVARDMNLDVQNYQPVIVYLNGAYWGIQNMREKLNEHFIAAHHALPQPDDPARSVDFLENENNVILGDNDHFLQILDYIQNHDMNTAAAYDFISNRIDLDSYWNYMCLEIFVDNTDWPGNNLKYWRPKTADGRWRWLLYDTDFGYDIWNQSAYNHNTLEFALQENGPFWPNPPWSTLLFRKILSNDRLRARFINRFSTLLNIYFTTPAMLEKLDDLQALLENDMDRQCERWGFSATAWQTELERIRTFLRNRPLQQQIHLMTHFGLQGSGLLRVAVSDSSAGAVYVSDIRIPQASWTGTYFTGLPIHIRAQSAPGYRFTGWSGDISSGEPQLEVSLETAIHLTANFEMADADTAALVINEINYHSAATKDAGDWVELYNLNGQFSDLSGWALLDEKDSHRFEFPAGTTIEADSFLVLAEDLARFKSVYPRVENVIGDLGFGLSGGGELVRLVSRAGLLVDSLTYDDHAPWPVEADGLGATLELVDALSDNSEPANWQAGLNGGTPGRRNSGLTALDEDLANQLTTIELFPNFPNPFNPETRIQFNLPRAGRVQIQVFNPLGRLVARLVDEQMDAGLHRVSFRPQNLASGIYMYTMRFNDKQIKTRKMILLH